MHRLAIIQHVPFEGPGYLKKWAVMRGRLPHLIRRYRGDALPEPPDMTAAVILGGPMNVDDEVQYPWLAEEKQWLAGLIERGVPVVGICLGAQLLAQVLGGEVFAGPYPEIGWFPVQRVTDAAPFTALPEEWTPLHWHGDTFTLPPGGQWLARSEAYPAQAFRWEKHVLGLQFHLEITRDVLHDLLKQGLPDGPSPYLQNRVAILEGFESHGAENHQLLVKVLDAFLGK